MYKKTTKIIASMLVFVLTMANFSVLGEVFASSLENQTSQTRYANVEFDAYFKNENQNTHSMTQTIGGENNLYTKIAVKNAGYLKNAIVEAVNANYSIKSFENSAVAKVTDSKVYYNQINNGNELELAIPIQMLQADTINVAELSKESKVKLTATYVDGNGRENSLSKEITVGLTWKAEKEAKLNIQIAKYTSYDVNGQKGLLMQMVVKSSLDNNSAPVRENKIEISNPVINGVRPQEIKVVANSTAATNGDSVNFSEENYTIDNEKVTITVNNEADTNGNVIWKKDVKDEFVVTYIYPEAVLSTLTEEGINLPVEAKDEITTYEINNNLASSTISGELELKEQVNNLVSFTVESQTQKISKGQIYANQDIENKIESEYKETVTTDISLAELTDKIVLEANTDNFVIDEENKLDAGSNTYYKNLTINKANFDTIFGEDGEVKVLVGTTLIETINKDTEANAEGKIVIDLSELNTSEVTIETTKPISDGKFVAEFTKAIKGEIEYTNSQVKTWNSLELDLTGKAINGETEIVSRAAKAQITFTEPTSQAEIIIDNSNLSTVVTNENVKITAALKTDTLDCKLYKNPTLRITLPKYIETVNVKNVEVLFETEGTKLTLAGNNVVTNPDGTKTIIVNLEGTQTEYTLGAVSKGVNVVVTADLATNKLTPNKQDIIKMTYTNSNVIVATRGAGEETNEAETTVNFVAPTGVYTTTEISNYAEGRDSVTTIDSDLVIPVPTMDPAREATIKMNVINNYNNTIDNVSILGRTFFSGNKNILTGADLGSNVNMPLTSSITSTNENVVVYYSENGEATKDLSIESNGWTLSPANLANVKSYLVVLQNTAMNTGDNVEFTYKIQIPENMQHNVQAFETYTAYFNNNLPTGTIADRQSSVKVGLSTGKGPVLETTLSSNIAETTPVQTGKFIKYTVTVKNIGEDIAENVVAKVNVPDATKYIEFYEGESGLYSDAFSNKEVTFTIGSIEPNKTVTNSFWVVAGVLTIEDICKDETHYITVEDEDFTFHNPEITHPDSDYVATTTAKATVSAKDLGKEITSNEVTNTLKNANFHIGISTTTNGREELSENDELNISTYVRAYASNKTLSGTQVKVQIPNELSYQRTEISSFNREIRDYETTQEGVSYDERTRMLTINLGDVSKDDNRTIKIYTTVNTLENGVYEKEFTNVVKVVANGVEEEVSNPITDKVTKAAIRVSQTSTIPGGNTVLAGEKYSYKVTIENIGARDANDVVVSDNIPEGLLYTSTKYVVNGHEQTTTAISNDNKATVTLSIPKGERAEVTFNVMPKELEQDTRIENKAIVTFGNVSETTNTITHTIEKVNYENPINTTAKRISGIAWEDANGNGTIDENENKLSNIQVLLFDNVSGKYVTDSTGSAVSAMTTENGTYTFENVEPGKYTVIFLYNNAKYSATTYKAKNVAEELNSDVVDNEIVIDGEKRIAAITEEITVDSVNIYNINIGLVENPKFDLKLNKTVSKITVQDANGTTVYDFKDTKLAKKDLVGKLVNGTTIIVEYKISVTNEGAISGYVKKIADYMPKEMKFNSELNTSWYEAENGTLYNASLANTLINPGETKEVTLLLTKKMTEENLGLYNNTAEIYEAYNDLGIADIDSTVGNKTTNEDDMSSADVLITVKTGQTMIFISVSIAIVLVIGTSAYFIKKKVLR